MRISETDIPKEILDLNIGVIGYGLLGRPIALCLRDSGHAVRVGLRENSSSVKTVEGDGFEHDSIMEISKWADGLFLLIPDDVQGAVYSEICDKYLRDGSIFVLAHGYSFLYEKINPGRLIDAAVIAPHGPGSTLRELYLRGEGLAAQVAIFQDSSGNALNRALALARASGHDKGGINLSSVEDEVVMDHFAEQMVLCGGVVELMRAAYCTLVDAGYDKQSAYESVVRELKYTVDLIYEHGPDGLMNRISKSALVGSMLNSKSAVGDDVLERMKSILNKIESGKFKDEFERISSDNVKNPLGIFLNELKKDFDNL